MTEQSSFDLPLGEIVIPNNRTRAMDPVWAEALGQLMKVQGQISPITVRKVTNGAYSLVTGLHRYGGAMANGSATIRCELSGATTDDEARLEEVMENLGRHELNALDRCHHLFALKDVYERMYPEAKNGGDTRSEKTRTQSLRSGREDTEKEQIFGFAKATADTIGLAERTIQMGVKIWKGLADESRARLPGTKYAEKQSELKLLSAQTKILQPRLLDLILGEEPRYHCVQDAIEFITKVKVTSDTERRYAVVNSSVAKLPDPDFDRLILAFESRIIAALKRQGCI